MIQTSAAYRPFPAIRRVDFELSFSVKDLTAKGNATIKTNDDGVLGGVYKTINDVSEPSGKYASLEKNLWTLDNTYDFIPDDPESIETGLWTNLISDDNGDFITPPTIRYTFENKISTIGWVIYFDNKANQYATKIRITTYDYDGVTVLDTRVYKNDSANFATQYYANNYYAIEFEFLSTNEPNRRLRLTEVDFGYTRKYDRNSLGYASLIYGADIISRSLPSRELVFTFDNVDKHYNLLSPEGVYQYLQDAQEIMTSIKIGSETIDTGKFYFTRSDVSKSAIAPEITANDIIYTLDGKSYDEGADIKMALSDAVHTLLSEYDIPLYFGGNSANTIVTMAIPNGTTVREAVRLIAQAAMCTVYVDRSGVLRFDQFELKSVEDGQITSDELYDYSGVSISDKIDGVTLSVENKFKLDENGKSEKIVYKSGSGMMIVSFENPCVAPENGAAVAAWLLAGLQRRKNYAVKNRCDPAVEIGDTLRIDDIFGNRETAVVTGIEIDYDGTLSAVTKGVGE